MKTLNCYNRFLPSGLTIVGLSKVTAFLILILFACMNSHAQEGYEADTGKLNAKARRSTDLYVEPLFNFDTHRSYTLDFYVVDRDGDPVGDAMLIVSAIPTDVSNVDEVSWEEQSLMSILKTDQFGRAFKIIEASQAHTNLLVELKRQSEGNKAIFDTNNSEYITHHFMIN